MKIKNYKTLFLLVFILLFGIVIVQFINPIIGDMLTSLLTTVTTIIGFIAVFFEMKRATDIDGSTFLLETYKHFTSDNNHGIKVIFEKLDMLFYENKNTITQDDRKYIVDYLEFFEMLSSIIEKCNLIISDIDRLYGYHFFLITNCKIIQDMELVPYKDFYEGIFAIYPEWKKYRIKNNKSIPFGDTPLIK